MDIFVNLTVFLHAVVILYDLFSHNGFYQKCRSVRNPCPVQTEPFPDLISQEEYAEHQWKNRGKYDCRQLRTDTEHKKAYYYDFYTVHQKQQYIIRKKVCQIIDIIGHTHYDFSIWPVVEIFKRQFLQLIENLFPDIRNNIMPHFSHQCLLEISDNDFNCRQQYQTGNHEG